MEPRITPATISIVNNQVVLTLVDGENISDLHTSFSGNTLIITDTTNHNNTGSPGGGVTVSNDSISVNTTTFNTFAGLVVNAAGGNKQVTVIVNSTGIDLSAVPGNANQSVSIDLSVSADPTDAVTVNGAIKTKGTGTVVLNATSMTIATAGDIFTSSGTVIISGSNNINTKGDITTISGNITFNDAVTLTGDIALNAGSGNILLNSTLVGGSKNLAISSSTGTSTFTGAITAIGTGTGAAISILSSGLVDFQSTIVGNSGIVSSSSSGSTKFQNNVTLSNGTAASSFGGTVTFDGLSWSSFDGLSITGATTLSSAAVSLDSNGGNITFGSALTGGSQNLTIALGTGAGTTTFSGAITGIGTGTGAAISIASSGLVDFQSTVNGASGITSTNVSGNTKFQNDVTLLNGNTASSFSGTVNFDGMNWSGFDGLSITGAATLSSGAVSLNSNGSAISFGSTLVGGSQNLIIASGTGVGTTTFIGAITAIGSGTGAAISIASTGLVDFRNSVSGISGIVSSNASGSTKFQNNVTLNNGDTASSFSGIVNFDGLNWSSFDGLSVTGAATLSSGAVNLNSNGGNILFSSTLVGGNQNLSIASPTGTGTVIFTSAITLIGTGTGAAISILSSGLVDFQSTVNGASGITSINPIGSTKFQNDVTLLHGDTDSSFSGTVNFDGMNWSGFNGLSITGAATLSSGPVNLNSNGDNITFSSTLAGGNQNLSIDPLTGTGTTTFTGAITGIGTGTGAAIFIASSGLVDFQSTVNGASGITSTNVSGTTKFQTDVTLLDGNTASSFSGTVNFDGMNWSGFDGLSITGAATLSSGAVSLNSNGGAISFGNTLTGGNQNLSIASGTAAGTTTFVGALTAMGTGIGATISIASTGLVDFQNTVIGASGIVSTSSSGSTKFQNNVTLINGNDASSFSGTVNFDGMNWSNFNDLFITGAATLSSGAVSLNSNGGNISFGSTLTGGGQNLTIAFDTGAGTTTFIGAITAVGNVTEPAIFIASSGLVDFQSTVNGTNAIVSTNVSGTTKFQNDVTLLNGNTASSFSGTINFDGMNWSSFDGLSVTGAATLSSGAVSLNSNGGAISFGSTLAGGSQILSIASGTGAGTTTFIGAITTIGNGTGAAISIASTGLVDFRNTVSGTNGIVSSNSSGSTKFQNNVTLNNGDTASSFSGTVNLDGLNWSSFDGLSITGAATLSNGTVSLNSNGGNILFSSTLVGGNQNLSIASPTGAGTVIFNGTITTIGTGLGAAISILSSGLVDFRSTVNGASGITSINPIGSTKFQNDVTLLHGDTASSFSGTVNFDGMNWSGFNGLSITGAATLSSGPVSLNSNGDNITFSSTLDGGNQNLFIAFDTGTGTATFTGAITGIGTGTGAAISIASSGLVDFQSTVNGASGINSSNVSGTTKFQNNVTLLDGDTASSFNGTVNFDGMNWSNFDGLSVTGAATLSSGVVSLNSNGSSIIFGNTLAGGNQNLSIASGTAAGTTTFVGALTAIGTGTGAAISLASTGLVDFQNTVIGASGIVSTSPSGSTKFQNNVTLSNGNTASSFSGTINFDGMIWSSFNGLSITGAATLSNGAVSLDSNGGNITFGSTLAGGSQNLIIAFETGDGTTTFTGAITAIGSGTGAAIFIVSSGLADFRDTVSGTSGIVSTNVSGSTKFQSDVTLLDGDTASSFTGTINFDGMNWSSFDGLSLTGPATLSSGAVSLNSNGAPISFGSTLAGGSQNLSIASGTAAGTTTFTGAITTIGTGTGAAISLASTGLVDFQSTVNGASGIVSTSLIGSTKFQSNVTLLDGNTPSSFNGTVNFDGMNWSNFDGLSITGVTTLSSSAVSLTSNGSNITFNDALTGAIPLALTAGAGIIDFNGAVGGTPLTSLTIASAGDVDIGISITASGLVSITSNTNTNVTLGTTTGGLHLAIGEVNAITSGSLSITAAGLGTMIVDGMTSGGLITGITTLTAGGTGVTFSGVASNFNNALTVASPSILFVNVSTSDDPMIFNAVTLGASVSLNTNAVTAAGNLTLGPVTGASFDLNLNTGATGSISGTSVAINDLTISNGASAAFTSAVTVNDLITTANPYSVSMTGTGNTFAQNVDFLNTGLVTLGNGTDIFLFNGGLNFAGNAASSIGSNITSGGVVNFGAGGVALTANSTLATTQLLATGQNILFGAGITDGINAFNIGLDAGTVGAITGTSVNINDLTINNGASAAFTGAVTVNDLITTANPYSVSMTGTGNTFALNVDFLNTGSVTLNNTKYPTAPPFLVA